MSVSAEIKIFTDSTSDLPLEMAKESGIGVIPASIVIGDRGFLDRETIWMPEIIDMLHQEIIPTTGSPGIGIMKERFQQAGDKQIISINISSKLSGIFEHATKAAENITPRPRVIDSGTTSMALGFLALEAARLARQGRSPAEIIATIEEMKTRSVAMVALPTTKYVELGGRISHLKGIAASMLRICPILEVRDGRVQELEKPRTWRVAKARLLEVARGIDFEHLAVMYVESDAEADELIRGLPVPRSREILKVQLGAALASHIGPGGLAVCGIKGV